MSVRLCHAGQNVLIVHNCLFNENIPLAVDPSTPPLPPWLRGGCGRQRCFFENCPAVKVAVTFSQCSPSLISSVLPTPPPPDPDTVSLVDSSPPLSPFSSQRDGIIAASTCNLQNQQQVTVPSYLSFIAPPHSHCTIKPIPDQYI